MPSPNADRWYLEVFGR